MESEKKSNNTDIRESEYTFDKNQIDMYYWTIVT